MIITLLTFYIFIIMSAVAKIHMYWMQGGLWPGENKQDLINKVIGQGNIFPSALSCLGVIIVFVIMALIPLGIYYKFELCFINTYASYIMYFFSGIFFLRASLMFIPRIEKRAHKIFIQYNKRYYAPLCFSLSFAYLILAGTV